MTDPALYLAISTAALLVWWWRYGWELGPDGLHYGLAMAGAPAMHPFRHRGLLLRWPWLRASAVPPTINKPNVEPWLRMSAPLTVRVLQWQSWVSLVVSGVLVGVLAEQWGAPGWLAVALFVVLPWFRHCARCVGYLDPLAMMTGLGAAVAWGAGLWWLAVPLSVLSGLTHERGPVFAALFAWSPWLLLGLLGHGLARLLVRGTSETCPYRGTMAVSFRAHREAQSNRGLVEWVLPWGAAIFGIGSCLEGSGTGSQLAALMVVSYGQLVVAMGCVRLVQWAAPLLCVAAALVMAQWPVEWLGVALALHVASPWSEARW